LLKVLKENPPVKAKRDRTGVSCPVFGLGWNFGCIFGAEFKKHFGRPPSLSGGHWNPPVMPRVSMIYPYQESCQPVVSAGSYDDLNIGRNNRLLGEKSRGRQTSGGRRRCAKAQCVTSQPVT